MSRKQGDALGTDEQSRYVTRFDWGKTTPTVAVVETIAAFGDRQSRDLDVLFDYIDPDALDRMFDGAGERTDLEVSFTFEGYRVTLRDDGTVYVSDLPDASL